MTHISTPTTLSQLVARSRKLGTDRSVCNWGGGNTSAKADEIDFRGRPARVLWVKGSGSDLATVTDTSFTGLYMDDVMPLLERERMSDTEMVDYLAHCFYEPGRPRPSIETLLHGFLPFTHVDHTHADATNYFACAADGEKLARDCFGDDLIWIPYRRPGFGGARVTALSAEERRAIASHVAPVLRGLVSAEKRQILRFEDTEDVLTFASSQDALRLTTIGAACPDHLVHTKPWPLLVGWTPEQDTTTLSEALRTGVEAYVAKYRHYLDANAQQDLDPDAAAPVYRESDAAADPHPRVIMIPGVGMFTTGKDTMMAGVSAQLYHRAISVMRGAEGCGGFISLSDAESYAVEYWPLEQYKLKLAPPEREFARHVVLVTGAAGGIGSAICRRVAQDGAHIVATDIDLAGTEKLAADLNQQYGAGRAVAVKMDVTSEESVRAAFEQAALAFGGIDVIVNNSVLAYSAPITETSLAEWNKNLNV